MANADRRVQLTAGELADRLTIDQIKQLRKPERHAAIEEEIRSIEHDLDAIFGAAGRPFSVELVRLTVALAQVNLHIWQAKETMQASPARFAECMKLAHQLNGIRNQAKNRISAIAGPASAPLPTNTSREDLSGWRFSVLDAPERDHP
jgi:hypothetical protein